MQSHSIPFFEEQIDLSLDWESAHWRQAKALSIESFHQKSSDHRPITQVKLFAAPDAIQVHFRVHDRYVMSVAEKYQDMVCRDSCVEFFWQPVPNGRYFNFEMNCGGLMLLYYIRDVQNGELVYDEVAEADAKHIQILTTMPKRTPVEIPGPIDWQLAAKIPYSTLTSYCGPINPYRGMKTRANFYKCGSLCSHPHWAAWAPTGENLSFHQPDKFGELIFS